MDLYFCDICDESIPASDLDRGMAFRRGERVVCAACDSSMSPKTPEEGLAAQESVGASALAPEESQPAQTAQPEHGDAVQPQVAKSTGLSVLWGFVKFAGLSLIVVYAYLERARILGAQGELQSSVVELGEADAKRDERFSDFQTTVSRTGQEEASAVSAKIAKARGDSEERLVNLRTRLGRIENSLESLRQEGVKDRQSLGEEMRALEAEVAAAKAGIDELGSAVKELHERVVDLEELLQGGLTLKGPTGRNGKAPTWSATLADLKDPSAGNRWTAVTSLGDTGDSRVVPYLLPMLKDEDVFVRMATARVLGELDDLGAATALIEALGDTQAAVREAAVVSLRLLSGKDFRFDPLGKEADRSKVQAAWRKWDSQRGED
jgi:hypothetical protein